MGNETPIRAERGIKEGPADGSPSQDNDLSLTSVLQPSESIPSRWRFAIVTGLIVLATVLHYGIDVQMGAVHDVLTRSYYIPIVLAGLWFGIRGGFLAALAVTIVFFPHALHGWNAPYSFVFRLIEILMYYAIGILTGLMSDRTRNAHRAERDARLERERALREKENAFETLKTRTSEVFELEKQVRRSDRLAALGKLSAGLAHEMNNPAAAVTRGSSLLAAAVERRVAAEAALPADAHLPAPSSVGPPTSPIERAEVEDELEDALDEAGIGRGDFQAHAGQCQVEQFPDIGLVVDDQDLGRHQRPRGGSCRARATAWTSEKRRVRLQWIPSFSSSSAARMPSQVEAILKRIRVLSIPASSYKLINS